MNLINGTIYKWYNDNVILSGAYIEINDNELYFVNGKDEEQILTLLEVLGVVDNNKLKTLNYNIESSEVIYIPESLVYYKYMKVSDLVRFYENTHNNFNIKKVNQFLSIFNIDKKKKVYKLDETSIFILRLIIGLSLEAKLYVVNGLTTQQVDINDKIINLINKEYEKSFIIYDKNKIINEIATKIINIKDYDKIEITGDIK